MPTMKATKTPQAPATTTSRRRAEPDVSRSACRVVITPSQRPVEHAGAEFDDGHQIDQQDQRCQRHRNGDGAGAPPAFLLAGEYDSVVLLISHSGYTC